MRVLPSRFHGWTVVAAAFVVAVFGWGVGFYGPPIYLQAVRDTRGWSVALVSTAMTVHFLVGAIAVANLPAAHRRLGVAATTVLGAACLAIGVVGWSLAAAPWQLFAAALASGSGWVALGAAGINAMVSPWFDRRRPAALSMAYNGASIGGVVFSPLWVAAIGWLGFPLAAVAIGVTMVAAIVVLSARVLNRTPESMGLAPDGDDVAAPRVVTSARDVRSPIRDPWRDRAFQTLALGMACGLFAQIGLIAHLFSLLTTAMGARGAGFAMGLATAAAILGRTLVGVLMAPAADRRAAAALNYGVQIIGCCVFLAAGGTNVALLLLAVLLFGAGIGNATSMPPLIAQYEFAQADTGRVVALITAVSQASYAFAPMAFGLIRDAAGPGEGAAVPMLFLTAAAFQLAGAAAYWVGREAWRRRDPVIVSPVRNCAG